MIKMIKIIFISLCKECPYLRHTESDWYCEKMPMSSETWRKIDDVSIIHKLCPLSNMK